MCTSMSQTESKKKTTPAKMTVRPVLLEKFNLSVYPHHSNIYDKNKKNK